MLRVGVGYSTRSWRNGIASYASNYLDDVVVVSLRDPASIAESSLDVLLIDPGSVLFTAEAVRRARTAGVAVVGVADDGWDDEIEAGFARLAIGQVVGGAAGMPSPIVLFDELRRRSGGDEVLPNQLVSAAPPVEDRTGGLIAVGGPAGSGRTELAVLVAATIAAHGSSVLLVDVNEADPHVAARLGLAPTPNIVSLIDTARAGHGWPIVGHLARPAVGARAVSLGFDVVAGMASSRDWQHIRPHELGQLLAVARREWDVVIATTAPLLEQSRLGDRWGLSRLVLQEASRVVGVCRASPASVMLLLAWIADAVAAGQRPIEVVVNQTRDGWREREVRDRFVADGGGWVSTVCPVGFDAKIAAADWDGSIRASRRTGRAITALVASVTAMSPPPVSPVTTVEEVTVR